ncbi:MAG: hypothetical protein WBQ08_22585 [Candidatus Sulfotelmatobacter sp.]
MLNNLERVGCCEAHRGTLIHHYRVDEQGLITWANLAIAAGHNNLAMNLRQSISLLNKVDECYSVTAGFV